MKALSSSASRLLLVAALGVGVACQSAICTDIGCESNLTFDFDGEHLPAGDYEISVESSNGEASCDVTIHDDGRTDADCEGDFEVDPSIRDVVVYDTPEEASLVITQDGETITSAEAKPEYSDYYPNGPDCDDESCQVAFVTAERP